MSKPETTKPTNLTEEEEWLWKDAQNVFDGDVLEYWKESFLSWRGTQWG